MTAVLSHEQLIRYSRHLLLDEVGVDGQLRLRQARVLLVGAGGLGSPAALYLAAAGVGTIGIVDADRVDHSNLQRQVLHGTGTVGELKTVSAEARLHDLNPDVSVEPHSFRLDSSNALELVSRYDLVVDGSDNFPTRYLVNDACVLTGRPYVYGSIFRFEGQVSVFGAPGGPCYRCLFAEPPEPGLVPSCAEAGVLGVLPGIVGSLQALEALKWILGAGESLVGRLLLVDALGARFRELSLRPDPDCPICGTAPSIQELIDYEAFCGVPGAEDAAEEISPAELADLRARGEPVQLVDVREPAEWEIVRIAGSRLLPLRDLPARLGELDARQPVVTICHHGVRSRRALELLRAAGFPAVRSLAGGVDRWAVECEPGMARY
jgi:molybdopterin/thiamine biosynthesis adenylyltransferase/rhodanese-related sulfurtransferase